MSEFPHNNFLSDYFEGKSTALQKQWIADWLKEPENQVLYYQYLNEWESKHPQYQPDVKPALAAFREAVQNQADEPAVRAQTETILNHWPRARKFWLLAASVLLFTLIGFLGRNLVRYETFETAYGETRSFYLSDGTLVSLNANSRLYVPRWGFGEKSRQVILDGEAEFNVKHLASNQKFFVKTSTDFAVEVLGTEFVVYAREQRRKVILSKGSVKVTYEPGKQLLMKPGDLISVGESGLLQRTKTTKPAQFASWKQQRFTFEQTSLAEISQLVFDNYGIKVLLADSSIARRRVSGVFEAAGSEELVGALADLLHLHLVKTSEGLEIRTFADKPAQSPKTL